MMGLRCCGDIAKVLPNGTRNLRADKIYRGLEVMMTAADIGLTGSDPVRNWRYLGGILLIAVLAGCTSDEDYQRRLANACKVQECVCVKRKAVVILYKPIPVLWQGTDGAYCPEEYSLQRAWREIDREDP